MNIKSKSMTTEKWTGRQVAIKLVNNRWEISFLATSAGSITDIGGMVAEFSTPRYSEVAGIIASWITSGVVPANSETHAPDWFKAI